MKNYTVKTYLDYPENQGNHIEEEDRDFPSFHEAEAYASACLESETTTHGMRFFAEIWEWEEDEEGETTEPILIQEYAPAPSAPLPEGAILVLYAHHRYMGYSYDIRECRYPNRDEKTYADLPPDATSTFRDVECRVYDSPEDLETAFRLGYGIFDKIHSGSHHVRAFLAEEVGGEWKTEEEEEDDEDNYCVILGEPKSRVPGYRLVRYYPGKVIDISLDCDITEWGGWECAVVEGDLSLAEAERVRDELRAKATKKEGEE